LAVAAVALAILVPIAVFGTSPASGPVFGWGDNASRPVEVAGLKGPVAKVVTGENYSLALMADGTVSIVRSGSEQVPGLNNVIDVAVGQIHGIALKSDGTVWAWGQDTCGQLGQGAGTGVAGTRLATPKQVPGLPVSIKAIAAGRAFNLALDVGGHLWAWGDNRSGQLGNGVPAHPRGASVFSCYNRGDSGTAQPVPTPVALADEVVSFAAGGDHALALTRRGQVWSWGSNCEGQLGAPADGSPTMSPGRGLPAPVGGLPDGHVVAVAAGGENFGGHSLALSDAGRVWAWGFAEILGAGVVDGQPTSCVPVPQATFGGSNDSTGLPTSRGDGRSAPVQVLDSDGGPLAGVVAMAAGTSHTLAVKADGKLVAWGRNDRGQLGLEGNQTRYSATLVPLPAAGGAPDVELVAASRRSYAVMGDHPPSRPSPEFTGVVPVPDGFPPDPPGEVSGPIKNATDNLEGAQQTVLETIAQPHPIPPVPAAPTVGKVRRDLGLIPPGTEGPVPADPKTQGGVFVTGMDGAYWPQMGDCDPRTACFDERSFHFLRRAISYVTPGQAGARVLFTGAIVSKDPENDEFSLYRWLKDAGFVRGCPKQGYPVAPGCFEVAGTEGDYRLADEETKSPRNIDRRPFVVQAEHRWSDVNLSDFDAVMVPPYVDEPHLRDLATRRQDFTDYVNSGGGLVIYAQTADGGLRFTSNGVATGVFNGVRNGEGGSGTEILLPFLNETPLPHQSVVDPEGYGQGSTVTPEGRALGLDDKDVVNGLTYSYYPDGCGFEVFANSVEQRIIAMGTHKPIPPPEGACLGVEAPDVSVKEGDSGTVTAHFRVSLNKPRTKPLTLDYATAESSATTASAPGGGKDFEPAQGTVTFPPGETGPKDIEVTVYGDTLVEPNETFKLKFSESGGNGRSQATGTIVNDDLLVDSQDAQAKSDAAGTNSTSTTSNPPSTSAHLTTGPAVGPAPAAASAQSQAVAQVQAPGAQAQGQGQGQSQAQGQSQVQAQSHANAPQVAVMKEKQKQEQLQRVYTNNQLVPAELLATSRRPNPVLPLALMAGSVISAFGLALFRRGLSPSSQEEKVPQEGEDQSDRPLWLRRKRSQR